MMHEHNFLQGTYETLQSIPRFLTLDDITWEVMNEKQLITFFKENYNMGRPDVLEWENASTKQRTFLGLEYTNTGIVQNKGHNYQYVVGITQANNGKKAVAAITKLAPKSLVFEGYSYHNKNIVLLAYTEVKFFCQGRHVFRVMAEKIADAVQGKVLAYTSESEMGRQLEIGKKLKSIMAEKGNPDCYDEEELFVILSMRAKR